MFAVYYNIVTVVFAMCKLPLSIILTKSKQKHVFSVQKHSLSEAEILASKWGCKCDVDFIHQFNKQVNIECYCLI